MPPKTRVSTINPNKADTGNTDKQTSPAIMVANGNASGNDPKQPEEESDHKLLLNIIANQNASDLQQETHYHQLDSTITATKQSLENKKALSTIKGNVTTNTTEIQNLQASVTKLQTDLTQMQSIYDATQKVLDETTANCDSLDATISNLDTKYVKDEEELLRCQLIIDGIKKQ